MNKELFWFNPRLLNLEINEHEAYNWHRAWFKLSNMNVCLYDSSGISKDYENGTNMKSASTTNHVYNIDHGKFWHYHFNDLMTNITDRIFTKAENKQEIRLSYSGGTDSCLVLAAMMSNPKIERWLKSKRFILYTTPYAKIEDPYIWSRIIDYDLPLRFLDYDQLSLDNTDSIMLTGEGNGYCTWYKLMLTTLTETEIFLNSYSEVKPKLETWFLDGDPTGIAWKFFNKLIDHTKNIDNVYQAWSLFETTCAEQCYMFRSSVYGHGSVKIEPNENTIWFMNNKNFLDLCFYEAKEKLYTTDSLLKYSCLRYIANWMNWQDVKPKEKISSQILVPKFIRKTQIFSDLTYTSDYELSI